MNIRLHFPYQVLGFHLCGGERCSERWLGYRTQYRDPKETEIIGERWVGPQRAPLLRD